VSPRLAILTGTLAGQTRAIGQTRLSLGRDALSDVRFDPDTDTDVSGRHAEVRLEHGAAWVRDTNSTNGVYVNGTRVRGEQRLADGDVIRLGATGPKIRFEANGAPRGERSTDARIAVAVGRRTRGLRAALLACVLLAIGGGWFALWSARRSDDARGAELDGLRRRNDSLSVSMARSSQVSPSGTIHASGQQSTSAPMPRTSAAAPAMDYHAVVTANGRSVVMIAVEMPDGKAFSGSGVSVSADGSILTNAHLVGGTDGVAPARIAVVFADTPDWLPAHIVRVAGDADLAVLRIERPGPFPSIARISDRVPLVGDPVAILGFPLGETTPMDGSTRGAVIRSTLTVGTISKAIPGVVQIDAFASEGSSGSPVFGTDGSLVALVYGGAPGTSGRIVYAVPAAAIRAILK
jgi:pSer/pThr/pTyr-binding forkhead associated (FHA) protein